MKTKRNLKNQFMDCDPKIHNLSKICNLTKCSYYQRCKSITKKKYNKLSKKIKVPKLFSWFL
jgi:hypothetical protein